MAKVMGKIDEIQWGNDYEERLLKTLVHLLQKEQEGIKLTDQEKVFWDGLRNYGIR